MITSMLRTLQQQNAPLEAFGIVLQRLQKAIMANSDEAALLIEQEKALILQDQRKITLRQKLEFWLLLAQYYENKDDANATLEALSLAEKACSTKDKITSLRIFYRRALIAFEHNEHSQAFIGFTHVIELAQSTLITSPRKIRADIDTILCSALIHRAFVVQNSGHTSLAQEDLMATQQALDEIIRDIRKQTERTTQVQAFSSLVQEIFNALQSAQDKTEILWTSLFSRFIECFSSQEPLPNLEKV